MKLIYIACPGHSGSTLLDMLLGSHEEVFSTGELVHLPNQYHRNKLYDPSPYNGLSCSCGNSFYDCSFWGQLIYKINDHLPFDITKDPLKFKIAFLMNHSIPHRKFIHKIQRVLFHLIIKTHLTFLIRLLKTGQRKIIEHNEILIRDVLELSNAKYIVDSTKDIIRLHYLLQSDIDIKVIVLKRNILGVSASAKKQKSSPLKTAKNWISFYTRLESVLNHNNVKPITINYEDLVENTKTTLNQLYEALELKMINSFSGNFNTKEYHIVAGNGLRYRGIVSVKIDDKWKQVLNDNEKKQISQLIGD